MSFRRAALIVLDGVGIGALPDAAAYGDSEANTLLHVAEACGGLRLPNLQRLGLGNLLPLPGVVPTAQPLGCYGSMAEVSQGKDSTTGHWELAGVVQKKAFPSFPQGFPDPIIAEFSRRTGLEPLGNYAASGTEILKTLGAEHLRSGRPIVYTSVDSVFQIAAHEEVIPVAELYRLCEIARELLNPWRVARVIARPFVGNAADGFKRTPRRHDFSLPPTGETLLDRMSAAGLEVVGVGKVNDLFAGRGVARSLPSASNANGMALALQAWQELDSGLLFVNLVDFDMLYGHRLDSAGFGAALEEFDAWLPQLQQQMGVADLLLITADHGCDPTTAGTDHCREYVPLLAWSKNFSRGGDLGVRQSFADVAETLAENFVLGGMGAESFLGLLRELDDPQ